MASDRIEELKKAGMKFDPDPPAKGQVDKIDQLGKEEFEHLVAATKKLTSGPAAHLVFKGNGHQTRTYEET